jgi:nucleoside-diphosphate-sugar epimerase
MRVAKLVRARVRVLALTSTPERVPQLRAQGIVPLQGNLDRRQTLGRLAGIATRVVHLAPPPAENEKGEWWRDPRTLALTRVLMRRTGPRSLVYGSTSGVYGDCAGEWVPETRPVQPRTPRAQRRVDAERVVRHYARTVHTRASILRIPGIYAPDRPGGTPRERLLKGTPVLRPEDDVYTNHIHADDLARIAVYALWRGRSQRVYNASDDTWLKMGDYFDLAADLLGLPRPPRVPRATAQADLPLVLLGFLSESRRLINARIKAELRTRLIFPTAMLGLVTSRGR